MEATRPPLGRTAVYVSNAGTKDITVLALDRESGRLEWVETVEVRGTDEPSPNSMPLAISPDRRLLYAALRSPPYPVSSFAIDPHDGRLVHRAVAVLPDSMAYLATDRTGRYLLSASYQGAKLAVSPIGADGGVRAPALQVVETPPNAHCVMTDASNRFVYATSLGGDVVLQYAFDAATGRMTPSGPAPLHSAPKAGPRHLVFHPNGRFLYLLNELDGTVAACRVDEPSGALQILQTLRLLPPGYPGKPSAADLHVTPEGRFLYCSERTSSTLVSFRIDAASGQLTLIESVATEPTPRGFSIDPRGRFLLAVGLTSNRMSVYHIDAKTGRLTRIGQYPMGSNPNWVEIVDLPETTPLGA
jgi:6-phosphogluconolactonase